MLSAVVATGAAAAPPFAPAPRGCAMAHCRPTMDDAVGVGAPVSIAGSRLDASAASNAQGLGCTSNATIAVCTSGDRTGSRTRPFLKAYDAAGRTLWDSGRALNSWAWTSVPIVDERGGAIAADDSTIVRFGPGGKLRWSAKTAGGAPISPTLTEDGTIVLATSGGPVSAYDPASGRRLATLDLRATLDGRSGRFDTTNTPARRGNRVYVSTELHLDDGSADPGYHARLYAIDVDRTKPPAKRLRIAWTYEFGARSGASPLVVGDLIVFDGDRATPSGPFSPRFFGVRDRGDRPKLVWQYELGGVGVASAARDPRGGAWVFAFMTPTLRRVSTADGKLLQTIDLDRLVGADGVHTPFSAMSIATGPTGHPVMIVTARAGSLSAYVVAVDLVTEKALWTYRVPGEINANTPEGQFPVLERSATRRSVFFSMRSGVRMLSGRSR